MKFLEPSNINGNDAYVGDIIAEVYLKQGPGPLETCHLQKRGLGGTACQVAETSVCLCHSCNDMRESGACTTKLTISRESSYLVVACMDFHGLYTRLTNLGQL